jgi:hypothetical protein
VPDDISKKIRGGIKEIHGRSTVGLKDNAETFKGDTGRSRENIKKSRGDSKKYGKHEEDPKLNISGDGGVIH